MPKLDAFSLSEIAKATGLSLAACSRIRAGARVPHPRHWEALTLWSVRESSGCQAHVGPSFERPPMALRAPLPSGTVTLLFTDIEGSTQHWEQQRAAMPDALRRHDELLRSAIEAHDGYVFKTVAMRFAPRFRALRMPSQRRPTRSARSQPRIGARSAD